MNLIFIFLISFILVHAEEDVKKLPFDQAIHDYPGYGQVIRERVREGRKKVIIASCILTPVVVLLCINVLILLSDKRKALQVYPEWSDDCILELDFNKAIKMKALPKVVAMSKEDPVKAYLSEKNNNVMVKYQYYETFSYQGLTDRVKKFFGANRKPKTITSMIDVPEHCVCNPDYYEPKYQVEQSGKYLEKFILQLPLQPGWLPVAKGINTLDMKSKTATESPFLPSVDWNDCIATFRVTSDGKPIVMFKLTNDVGVSNQDENEPYIVLDIPSECQVNLNSTAAIEILTPGVWLITVKASIIDEENDYYKIEHLV